MRKFFKRYGKQILTAAIVTAATILVYILAHKAATAERGYEALGGEMFVALAPAFIATVRKTSKHDKGVRQNVLQ